MLRAAGRAAGGASNTIDFAPPIVLAVQRSSSEDRDTGEYFKVNGGQDVLIRGVNFGVSMWSDADGRAYQIDTNSQSKAFIEVSYAHRT